MKITSGSPKHKQLMEAGGVSKLHLAVFQGKQEKARKLLEKGCPDVNKGDKFGQTPLHIACHREGLLGCLKLLATHQADLKALDANGNTALHSAAGSGAAAAAEFLLGRGLSVADKNKDGHTPMDICNLHCPPDKQASMKALLNGGAKVEEDRAAGGDSTAANTTAISTPAAAAAAAVRMAPSYGGALATRSTSNTLSEAGDARAAAAPAMGIAASGHDAGAGAGAVTAAPVPPTPIATGGTGRQFESAPATTGAGAAAAAAASAETASAISVATTAAPSPAREPKKTSRSPFLSALHRGGSSMGGASATSGDAPPSKAVEPARSTTTSGSNSSSGGIEEQKQTMKARSSTGAGAESAAASAAAAQSEKAATEKRKKELHLAIFQGDTAKVESVVERGDLAALNEADRHGQTPLHLACYKGSRVMTRLLVEGGADLEAVDVNGNGVVHAAVCDSPAVLAILIDHGADVTVSNYDGLTPKRLCEQYCPPRLKERMLQLLKEATLAQAKANARKEQLAEEQLNIEAVYHQLAMLRSKLAATAAANTDVPASEAAEGTQTENALLTLVEANVRVVEGQRHALEEMDKTTARMERMFRRLHMRLDAVNPGDVSFS
eukprot:g9666.t2